MGQIEILHAVVEHQNVGVQLLDGKGASLDAVAIDHHRHPIEILGEHEWLIPRELGIEQQRLAGGHDFWHFFRIDGSALGVLPFLGMVELLAFVAAGKDCHPAALVSQLAGQQFHHRSLAGPAHRDVADGDHPHAEVALRLPALAVAPQAQLDQNAEHAGEGEHEEAHQGGANPLGATKDHVRTPALEFFNLFLHPARGRGLGPRPETSRKA